ncbi:UNVERIFIED_CONTAM: hypothetical protein Sradi_4081300 [Sesamum radiatum]|uniref:Uncharacterized protein n=1 Tax=Sesamum radiatum TaxID=300843 RepID=A0AAW2PJI6_SESRA
MDVDGGGGGAIDEDTAGDGDGAICVFFIPTWEGGREDEESISRAIGEGGIGGGVNDCATL